jgi:hypothetical protein
MVPGPAVKFNSAIAPLAPVHWVQQERPAETNAALLSFLASAVGSP